MPDLRAQLLPILALAVGCSHLATPAAAPGDDVVVAELAGQPITQTELDSWIRNDLFEREARQSASKLYELRSSALERMIDERLVDAARAGSGLDAEAWIQQQVQQQGGVTAEAIATFYEQNKQRMGGAPLEQVSGQISRYLTAERGARVVAALRQQSQIEIRLAAPRVQVAAIGPSRGPESARVTIVEFSDFQCPFCKKEAPVIDELLARYPNDLRVVYRQLPLTNIHPRAQAAAEASLCAHEQGRFWEYHDRLFDAPGKFSDDDLARMAREAELDTAKHASCVAERRTRSAVEADMQAAEAAGISGTPAFLVNGILLSGAQPASAFTKLIDRELAAAAAAAPEPAPR